MPAKMRVPIRADKTTISCHAGQPPLKKQFQRNQRRLVNRPLLLRALLGVSAVGPEWHNASVLRPHGSGRSASPPVRALQTPNLLRGQNALNKPRVSFFGCDGEVEHTGGVKWPNVEVWHRLPRAPLRNRVEGCSQEGHFDSGRVAGCPPPCCSALDFVNLTIPSKTLRALRYHSLSAFKTSSIDLPSRDSTPWEVTTTF